MSEQNTLTRRIATRVEAIKADREQEGIILANLGQAVLESGIAEAGPLADSEKTLSEVTGEIQDLENAFRRLLSDGEKRSALQEEKKSLNVELRNMKNKEEPLFEELGRCAWDLWKSNRVIDDRLEEALDDLVKAELRLHEAEDAMLRNEKDPTGRALAILSKGKALLLAGRRKSASSALERLWGKAGRKIREIIPSGAFTDTPAAVSSSTLAGLSTRRNEITEREQGIAGELEALDIVLEEMPGKGGTRKRSEWIEDALESKSIKLDIGFRDLGRLWIDNNGAESKDPTVVRLKEEWSLVDQRITRLEDEKQSLSTHITYLGLESQRAQVSEKASRLESDIRNRQSELKKIKKELASLDKDLAVHKADLPALPEDD